MPRPKLTWRQRQALADANARDWDARTAARARETHLTGVTLSWETKQCIAWIDGEPAGSYDSYAEALATLPNAAQARIAAEAKAGGEAFFKRAAEPEAEEPWTPVVIDTTTSRGQAGAYYAALRRALD